MRKKFPIRAITSMCCITLIIIVGVVLIVNNSFQPENSRERDLSEFAFDNLDIGAPVGVGFNLAFENGDFIIFYGDEALFGYDLSEEKITSIVDFTKTSGMTGAVQGNAGTRARISQDGQNIILVYFNVDIPDIVYDTHYISIPTTMYHCGEYHPAEDAFNPENTVGCVLPGAIYSRTQYIHGDSSWNVFNRYEVE